MDHRPITIPPSPQVPTVWAYLTGTKMKRWMKDSKGSTPSALNLVAKPMSLHTHWLRALSLRTIIISLPFPSTGFPSTPFVLLVSAPSCMPTQQTDFHTVWQIPLGKAGKVYLIQTNHFPLKQQSRQDGTRPCLAGCSTRFIQNTAWHARDEGTINVCIESLLSKGGGARRHQCRKSLYSYLLKRKEVRRQLASTRPCIRLTIGQGSGEGENMTVSGAVCARWMQFENGDDKARPERKW